MVCHLMIIAKSFEEHDLKLTNASSHGDDLPLPRNIHDQFHVAHVHNATYTLKANNIDCA